ncbi:DNA helicase RecG [Fusobacterium nucleatum subsp. nucleatum ATCC 25586]|uniref:ATP-dependent DNA helicase RecG n=1 Tax=Fusobacterium nucleatum subsp. nucleatum (strain ATCC 25586 / DSM 15643 / BCRC 10681 / CIP 101130 / JCM 8532 / KCTC 2640 / LMG 13131 / VPI 4355) TaxID=190304 RepID=Q8R6G4_FUSNN|nr:ATP-dependent DNA helicase RecG [Fusobacterium nucleatum]AAL93775.1 ATP-dependent DNA helicase recG [Fusobacterium nucleatum subsp. nucleatum ATCC 25586]AVQ14199.1 DNA helicase RecG [Fusobacterium nucleatum subsp. nucleatum ATCC 25586]WMS28960.1 ATP-dependent DNA helicase RecG [Fusobacterium nucleatum]
MIESYRNIYSKLEDIPTKYITAKQLSNLKSLGINTVYDLIYYFPRAYDDRTNIKKIGELKFNEYVVLKATVMSAVNLTVRSGKKIVKAMVTDGTGIMEILWFGMPYIKKSLKIGEEYLFIGQTKKSAVFQLINPEYKLFSGQQKVSENEILPIYSSNKNITQNSLRKLVEKFLVNFLNYFEENIPKKLIKEYKIMERKSAIKNIHYPVSMKEIEEAKRRFAIEELLILELGILKNRFIIENSNSKNYEVEGKKEKVREFLSQLTFNLTNAQKKVIKEIYDEISNGKIVNRLIQGDVGSGKTVVAMVMLIYMAENGYQGALMAPTEILANQHYLGIKERLEQIGLRVELLTSSIKGKKKNEILDGIANGDIDIVIGTHSLIEDDVIFKKLGLIVIDEQHRFGVNQRNKLREKGFLGNLLVMSATPIPRSLALSIYGDLDLSIIDELPPGRTPIKTKWIANDEDLEKMYNFIYKKVNDGNQAYFVAPLIETSDKMALKSVDKVSEEIERKFSNKKIGIIHGKMKAKEKDEVMLKFKNKEYDILIATTVIEVGIDVPASTIMTIYNAERFGLSALHQLRGRVGRGSKQSYCFLISNSTTENSKQRLSIMEETEDGFRIAEEDLKLRNSGEIFGLRQSGFSDLKFIDIIYDVKTIKLVRDECIKYLKEHKGEIDNIYLKYDIEQKFSDIQAGN